MILMLSLTINGIYRMTFEYLFCFTVISPSYTTMITTSAESTNSKCILYEVLEV